MQELQRLQEQSTGKKRVDRVDWLYAAPSNDGGALGNARISQGQMEDYLLGKRRVDEALSGADKNVSQLNSTPTPIADKPAQIGNNDKDFIAVQNANTARDTAAKIREDPLLAIRRQEQEAMKALANRPDIRRQLKAAAREKSESKEERKARKKAEKEDKRRERHERHEHKRRRMDHDYSPRSEYSDEYRERRRSDERRYRDRSRSESPRRYRDYSRDLSPKREPDEEAAYNRKSSPRRYRDALPRRRDEDDRRSQDKRRDDGDAHRTGHNRDSRSRGDDRIPAPRDLTNGDGRANGHADGHSNGHSNGHSDGDREHSASRDYRPHPTRPSALDMADQPTSSSSRPPFRPNANGSSQPNGQPNGDSKPNGTSHSQNLDDMRAARLAAMTASAHSLQSSRDHSLATRAEQDRREAEKEERMRSKYGKDVANAGFFNSQREMGLGESLSRRGGKGLQRDRDL